MMKIAIESGLLRQIETEALIVPVFEGVREERFGAAELTDAGEVTGKYLELTLIHHPQEVAARRVLLAGAGKVETFDAAQLRRLSGAAVRLLKTKSVKKIALALDPAQANGENVSAAVEGAILGDFEPDRYKTGDEKKSVDSFTVVVEGGSPELEAAADSGRILAEAQNYTRDLVNEPANLLTPLRMAEAAQQMAAEYQLDCEILYREEMEKLGMGALLCVAQGSAEPPALIVVRYKPSAGESKAHLGLVGKGAMRAIAQLKPAIPVTAFVPCVENMPGSRAVRPGDIVTAMSGKTIEVINTDAEGRLILADALHYARQQGCTHMVDAATLTGAIVVALGHLNVGLFANDDGMRDRVLAAAKAAGERMWAMPLEDDYKDYLKSPFADLANVGGRWGGAVTAAIFLKEFAGDTPWVHLDIAGTAWIDDVKPFVAKGPSGVPVRTLVRLAMDW